MRGQYNSAATILAQVHGAVVSLGIPIAAQAVI
jgi:hypothetical protein